MIDLLDYLRTHYAEIAVAVLVLGGSSALALSWIRDAR
jgi:hypothetical protein